MPITSQDAPTTQNPQQQSTDNGYVPLNAQLADIPSYQASSIAPNPYQAGSPQADIYNAYVQMGRAPEAGIVDKRIRALTDPSVFGSTQTLQQQLAGIASSQEAKTLGRARNEVNSLIDAQKLQAYQESQTARQMAQSKLSQLNPLYEGQLNELMYGLNTNQSALDEQLATLMNEYNTQSTRLGQQYEPARIAALGSAVRSGLLNSTIAIDRLNQGFNPISQALGDLAVRTQSESQSIEDKRQNLIEQFVANRGNLFSKRDTEAQGIIDAYNLALEQALQKQSSIEAQRLPSVQARAGELTDNLFNQNLQSRQLDYYFQQLAQQGSQFDQRLALAKELGQPLAA